VYDAAAAGIIGHSMVDLARKTQTITGLAPDRIPYDELLEAGVPAILKGVASHWPLVRQGLESRERAVAYLKRFCGAKPVLEYRADAASRGRFFYNAEFTGFNFETRRAPLGECLDRILAQADDDTAPSSYIGSTDLDVYLPGLRAENALLLDSPMFATNPPVVSIWLGNRTIATAHFDQSHNLACCMVGHRRFSLFPPEQVHNLYPGPLEPTPGGQVVSVVDFDAPDFARFPRFREALAAGQVAEIEPGDVLFYPALWWHHVEALDSFNAMINYWWNPAPDFIDSPQNTLLHALLSLRDRPEREKRAWRELFDYYVFGPADSAGRHLPEHARGNLAPMDELKARRLRAFLLSRMNR
jgi:hypothetical protein